MPSVLSHIAVPIAARIALGRNTVVPRLLAVGHLLSVLPDADVILLRLGVPYESPLGHRGVSHSIAFAILASTVAAVIFSQCTGRAMLAPWLYLSVCAVSHSLLDTCTNAGHGAALLWPLSDERFFAPYRPIEASPLSLRRFFGEPGLRVLLSELLWVWLPLLAIGSAWRVQSRVSSAA
jgi:inner membrane protein